MASIDRLTEAAQAHLSPGETVLVAVMGAYERMIMGKMMLNTGVILATSHGITLFSKGFFGKYDLEMIPYRNVSSIEAAKGAMGHTLTIHASGNKINAKWITKGDMPQFLQVVRARIGSQLVPVAAPSPAPDLADQLRKLATLKDEGILSDEEFQAKKKQLLEAR